MDIFIELDANPSKVVSLYPESIAGRLSIPEKDWIVLFGGPKEEVQVTSEPTPSEEAATTAEEPQKAESGDPPTSISTLNAPVSGATTSLRGYLPSLMRPTTKDDDTASVASRRSARRRVTTDLFETFGVSNATNNSNAPQVTNAPASAPTTNVPAQLSPGRCRSSTYLLL